MIKSSYCLSEISSLTEYHNSTLSKRFTKEGIPKIKEGSKTYFKFTDLPADIKEKIAQVKNHTYEVKVLTEDDHAVAGDSSYSEEIEGIGIYSRPTGELTAEIISHYITLFGADGARNILTIDYCLHPNGTAPDDPGESDGD